MSLKFEDEYAYTLDNLASALKRSYEQIKQTNTFSSEFDYSQAIAKRLRAFYCSQLEIKEFLKKEVAQAGSDFFVETVLFFLKLFNDLENLGLEIASERPLQRKRNTVLILVSGVAMNYLPLLNAKHNLVGIDKIGTSIFNIGNRN